MEPVDDCTAGILEERRVVVGDVAVGLSFGEDVLASPADRLHGERAEGPVHDVEEVHRLLDHPVAGARPVRAPVPQRPEGGKVAAAQLDDLAEVAAPNSLDALADPLVVAALESDLHDALRFLGRLYDRVGLLDRDAHRLLRVKILARRDRVQVETGVNVARGRDQYGVDILRLEHAPVLEGRRGFAPGPLLHGPRRSLRAIGFKITGPR